MEPVVKIRGGPNCPASGTRLWRRLARTVLIARRPAVVAAAIAVIAGASAAAQDPSRDHAASAHPSARSALGGNARGTNGSKEPAPSPSPATVASRSPGAAGAQVPAADAQTDAKPPTPREVNNVPRYCLRDDMGDVVVTRLYGRHGSEAAVLQPDGQIGIPNRLVPTEKPFVPLTSDEMRERLEHGPYAGYKVMTTTHYVIFYQCKEPFAQNSAKLLEDLYDGLIQACRRHEIPVHEAEFPLVAVIFATERDFRTHKRVDPEVQAYYEIFTNRIFFYEQSERDLTEPRLMALRKPQTVAHEGVHQILTNIGVQPRLSDWPPWLIEGFAEYCATPTRTKKGLAFDRLGTINALHMATLRELDDPLSNEIVNAGARVQAPARPTRLMDVESLIKKTRLTPTDYAQSWALTHYLAQKRYPDFLKYLKSMSAMPPLEPRTPEDHLVEFRKAFGSDLSKLDKKVEDYIRKISQKGNFTPLPYYAVIFEQPLGAGTMRRAAMISQSPQVIQRWVEKTASPQGGIPNWQAFPFPTRARALIAAEEWMRAN